MHLQVNRVYTNLLSLISTSHLPIIRYNGVQFNTYHTQTSPVKLIVLFSGLPYLFLQMSMATFPISRHPNIPKKLKVKNKNK